jgi:hypothetical protein
MYEHFSFIFLFSLRYAMSLLFPECEPLHLLCVLPGLCQPVGELSPAVLTILSGAILETRSFHSSILRITHSSISRALQRRLT